MKRILQLRIAALLLLRVAALLLLRVAALLCLLVFVSSCKNEDEESNYAFTSNVIHQRSKDDVLQILCFTSSWGVNTWYYIPYMLKSLDVRFRLEAFYAGSADFDVWESAFNGVGNPTLMHFVFDNSDGQGDFEFSQSPELGDAKNVNIVSAFLKNKKFDVVFTQQGAEESIDASKWEGHEATICQLIKEYLNTDGVVIFNSTWSPSIVGYYSAKGSDGNYINGSLKEQGFPDFFSNYGGPSLTAQNLFQTDNWQNTQNWIGRTGMIVVPNGSLMYMLRNDTVTNRQLFWSPTWDRKADGSYVFDELRAGEDFTYTLDKGLATESQVTVPVHDTQLCPDGLHAAAGLPSFALALNMFATVFTPMYGVDISDVKWRPVSMSDKKTGKAGAYPYVGVVPSTTNYEIPLDKRWDAASQSYVDDESQVQFNAICRAVRKAQANKFGFVELEEGDMSNYVWR